MNERIILEEALRRCGPGQVVLVKEADLEFAFSIMDRELMEGRKFDQDKVDYSLLEKEWLEGTARVFMYGAEKYGRNNYKSGMAWGRVFAALMRHMWSWWRGEELDEETKESHLLHASCCLSMLYYFSLHKVGQDDRYNKKETNDEQRTDGKSNGGAVQDSVVACGLLDLRAHVFTTDEGISFIYADNYGVEYWRRKDGGVVRYDSSGARLD